MKKLHTRLSKTSILSTEEQKTIKGGKRLVTTNYSKFCAKRDQLQASGTPIMGIVHVGNQYCLEW